MSGPDAEPSPGHPGEPQPYPPQQPPAPGYGGPAWPSATGQPAPGGYPYLPAGAPVPMAPAPPAAEPWVTPPELRAGLVLLAALAVVGVLAGVLWKLWTVKTHGFDIGNGVIVPDETEGWVGADAHFAVITGLIGLVAGVLAWRLRAVRGPAMVISLAVGAVLGSLIAAAVGHLIGGGNHTVQANTNFVDRLPLSVHAHALLFVEGALALIAYLGAALFVDRDDLGVPSPSGSSGPAAVSSAGAEHRPDGLGWHGDGPGGTQQGDLAAQ